MSAFLVFHKCDCEALLFSTSFIHITEVTLEDIIVDHRNIIGKS